MVEEIGKRVKELRIEHGLKQSELAAKINVSTQMVSNLEREYNKGITAGTIEQLARALETTCDYLITGKSEPISIEIVELNKALKNHVELIELLKFLDSKNIKRVEKYIKFVLLDE